MGSSPADFEGTLGPQRPSFANDDFTFEFQTWPGLGVVRVTSPSRTVTIKAVRLNGVDVTDTGIEFGNAQNVTGVEVELTDRPTEVSGVVTGQNGNSSGQYSMLFFSQDRERWKSAGGRHLALARADQDGRFMVRALPPGDYCAVAIDNSANHEWSDPEFLETLRPRASRFSLGEGEVRTVTVEQPRR